MQHSVDKRSRSEIMRKVTRVSAMSNASLAVSMVTIGYISHSHALFADGMHTFSDLVTDILAYAAAYLGNLPADENHPYGHYRFETIATGLIAAILCAAGVAICFDALMQWQYATVHVIPSTLVLIVACVSIIMNECLYRYINKQAIRLHSNLLKANALHQRSDALSSILVLIAAIFAFFNIFVVDFIMAIIIGLLIIKIGISLGWDSLKELVDTGADKTVVANITKTIKSINGVKSIHLLRTRTMANKIYVDVHVITDSYISVSEGHYVSEKVSAALHHNYQNVVDVTVHIDPEDDEKNTHAVIKMPDRRQILNDIAPCLSMLNDMAVSYAPEDIIIHYLDDNVTLEIKLMSEKQKINQKLIADKLLTSLKSVSYLSDVMVLFHVNNNL